MEIVAWLVAHDGVGDRLQIARDLWPRDPAELSGAYLRQHLYLARQAMGAQAIVSVGDGLLLNPDLVESDWGDLRSRIQSGGPIEWDPGRDVPEPRDVGPWWGVARERIRAEIAAARPKPQATSTPIAAVRRKWEFALFAVPLVALVMLPWALRSRPEPPISLDTLGLRLEAVDARLLRSPNSDADHREQAGLIRSFSAQCWQKMWGRDEPAVVSFCRLHLADVRSAVAWSLDHDPVQALEIVGDGHRIFDQCMPTEEWCGWDDAALARDPRTDPVSRGRALCGIAFVHLNDDPRRAYAAATEAEEIFRGRGDRWDEANALRHEGFVLEAHTGPGTPLLLEALRIFEQIEPPDDQRGLAMTWESLAERTGKEPPGGIPASRELVSDWYEASKRFRLLGNERLALLCIRGMAHQLRELASSGGPTDDWRACRAELSFWASQKASEIDDAGRDLSKECIEGDVVLHDIPSLTLDLIGLLHQRAVHRHSRGAMAFLYGALHSLEARQGLEGDGDRFFWDKYVPFTPGEKSMYQKGLSATPAQILQESRYLDTVGF